MKLEHISKEDRQYLETIILLLVVANVELVATQYRPATHSFPREPRTFPYTRDNLR